jgi:hypothetical protein
MSHVVMEGTNPSDFSRTTGRYGTWLPNSTLALCDDPPVELLAEAIAGH